MNIGKLNKRIELKSNTPTRDSYGGNTDVWATYTTVWASIEPIAGKELLQMSERNAELTHKITIRYNSLVSEKHRVLYGTRTFVIVSIINKDEIGEYQEIMCKEVK